MQNEWVQYIQDFTTDHVVKEWSLTCGQQDFADVAQTLYIELKGYNAIQLQKKNSHIYFLQHGLECLEKVIRLQAYTVYILFVCDLRHAFCYYRFFLANMSNNVATALSFLIQNS